MKKNLKKKNRRVEIRREINSVESDRNRLGVNRDYYIPENRECTRMSGQLFNAQQSEFIVDELARTHFWP